MGIVGKGARIAWILTKFELVTLQRIVKKERNGLNSNWAILHSMPNDELDYNWIKFVSILKT